MNGKTEVDLGVVIPEDKQMNKKKNEMEESGFFACQMTFMMTEDKISTALTPNKEKNKELDLSELERSPAGSFQSLQSSQSSEGGNGTSIIPLMGGLGC